MMMLCCGFNKKGKRPRSPPPSPRDEEEGGSSDSLRGGAAGAVGFAASDDFELLCGGRARRLKGARFRSLAHPQGWWHSGEYAYLELRTRAWSAGGRGRGRVVTWCVMADGGCEGEGVIGVLLEDLDRVSRCYPPNALRAVADCAYLWLNEASPYRGACTHHARKDFAAMEGGPASHPHLRGGCGPCGFEMPEPRPKALEVWSWEDYASRYLLKRSDTLLHEFGHIFHSQVLGCEFKGIRDMYAEALEGGKYDEVRVIGQPEPERAYGLNNEMELFASLTVPLFGGYNDYEPFSLDDFANFDPYNFTRMKAFWGAAGDDVDALIADLEERREHDYAPSNPNPSPTPNPNVYQPG